MLQRGDVLLGGRYRIDDPAGEKKACVVFKAKRVSDGAPVALRMLAPFLLRQPHIVARLKSRAEFAMGMDHPNLTRVHEVNDEGGSFVIAESWHEALPLLRVVRGKGACSPYETAWIASQLARGVDHLISSGAPGFEFGLMLRFRRDSRFRRKDTSHFCGLKSGVYTSHPRPIHRSERSEIRIQTFD